MRATQHTHTYQLACRGVANVGGQVPAFPALDEAALQALDGGIVVQLMIAACDACVPQFSSGSCMVEGSAV